MNKVEETIELLQLPIDFKKIDNNYTAELTSSNEFSAVYTYLNNINDIDIIKDDLTLFGAETKYDFNNCIIILSGDFNTNKYTITVRE